MGPAWTATPIFRPSIRSIKPLQPAATDLLQPEMALVKKAQLFGQVGFAQRVMAGDPESVRQWKEVSAALSPKVDQTTQEASDYNQRMAGLSILKAKADLPEAAWSWAASNGPVSPEEKMNASFAKARNMSDAAWRQRYFLGDRQANSEMTNINLILAAKVGTFEEIERHKVVMAKLLGTRK